MRSIKFGLLAIICLLYGLWNDADFDEIADKDMLTPPDYVEAVMFMIITLFGSCCFMACLLTPAEKKKEATNDP